MHGYSWQWTMNPPNPGRGWIYAYLFQITMYFSAILPLTRVYWPKFRVEGCTLGYSGWSPWSFRQLSYQISAGYCCTASFLPRVAPGVIQVEALRASGSRNFTSLRIWFYSNLLRIAPTVRQSDTKLLASFEPGHKTGLTFSICSYLELTLYLRKWSW